MKKLLVFLALLFIAMPSMAYDWQAQSNDDIHKDMVRFARDFSKRAKGTPQGKILKELIKQQKKFSSDRYAWIGQTVDAVLRMEKICTPTEDDKTKKACMRRNMLLLLDYPLHTDNRAKDAPKKLKETFSQVSESYRAQGRKRALTELEKAPKLKDGELQVIKIYNCGVILRTSKRTIAVDIKWEGDDTGAQTIASKIDAFFLSHPHKDHYSESMVRALAQKNVHAILPKNILPQLMWKNKHVIFEDHFRPIDINGIRTVIQTGYQKNVPNNAYILEMDGWRILLPGESGQYKRLYEFSDMEAPHLILVPTWNKADKVFYAVSKMQSYSPSGTFCIPEHENELTHTINHRESYRELFTRKDRLGDGEKKYPRIILLDIGETYILSKGL